MKIVDLDHIVLRTADVERALDFYTGVLGLTRVRVEEWRAGTVAFPSVRLRPLVPKFGCLLWLLRP